MTILALWFAALITWCAAAAGADAAHDPPVCSDAPARYQVFDGDIVGPDGMLEEGLRFSEQLAAAVAQAVHDGCLVEERRIEKACRQASPVTGAAEG